MSKKRRASVRFELLPPARTNFQSEQATNLFDLKDQVAAMREDGFA
jgi:hypothetical protein